MANRSKILGETAESINSAVRALNSLSDVIDGSADNPIKIHGCKGAVRFLIDEGTNYEELLDDVYVLIADEWEHIENNAARIDELKEFFKVYDHLRDAVQRLDNCYIDYRDKAESITGDSTLSQEYVLFVCKWDEKFGFVRTFLADMDEKQRAESSPYAGMALAMIDFFDGLTDAQLEDALILHEFPMFLGNWKGALTNATYFGHHFHLSCLQMNKIFKFRNGEGEQERLHYTRFPDTNIKETSGIAVALKPYKFIRPRK